MSRWIVWALDRGKFCYECSGGGDADVWQVYAESPTEALRLVRDSLDLQPYDDSLALSVLFVGESRARKARIIPPNEWSVDGQAFVDAPEYPDWELA